MSNDRPNSDLANLDNIDIAELGAVWQRHLIGQAPAHLPRSLLARLLAYNVFAFV